MKGIVLLGLDPFLLICVYPASYPSAHEAATAGTSVVDSTKVAPLEPSEKSTYA